MFQKCTFLLVVLMAVATAGIYTLPGMYTGPTTTLLLGIRKFGDNLALQEKVLESPVHGRVLMRIQTFEIPARKNITQVVVVNNLGNWRSNGIVLPIKNGPGHQNVTLKFISQRSHPLNFTVSLYAR